MDRPSGQAECIGWLCVQVQRQRWPRRQHQRGRSRQQRRSSCRRRRSSSWSACARKLRAAASAPSVWRTDRRAAPVVPPLGRAAASAHPILPGAGCFYTSVQDEILLSAEGSRKAVTCRQHDDRRELASTGLFDQKATRSSKSRERDLLGVLRLPCSVCQAVARQRGGGEL